MATEAPDAVTMDKIVALCKRRGFMFQSSEIYGGLGSAYDYGHYGVLLKTNVKNEWWRAMIQERDDIVALDSAIILHPKTWEASGHLGGFTDPLVQCLGKCKQRFREDHLREKQPEGELKCPVCGGELTEPRHFNLMFETHVGPVEDEGSGLPAPRDRPGHLRQLQERPPDRPQEAAVRHRAGRQVVPQRDHAGQLHLPHARVRADGDGVLRAARPRRRSGTSTGRPSAGAGTRSSASGPTTCACASTTRTSCRTTRARPPTSSTCSRSAGPSSRGSPTAATSTSPSTRSSPARSSSTSTRRPASATSRT